VFGIGRILCIY